MGERCENDYRVFVNDFIFNDLKKNVGADSGAVIF